MLCLTVFFCQVAFVAADMESICFDAPEPEGGPGQGCEIRHLGAMAQDMREAFGLGDSDKSINAVDADGIALAAIQGLNKKVQDQSTEIQTLKQEIEALKALVHK